MAHSRTDLKDPLTPALSPQELRGEGRKTRHRRADRR